MTVSDLILFIITILVLNNTTTKPINITTGPQNNINPNESQAQRLQAQPYPVNPYTKPGQHPVIIKTPNPNLILPAPHFYPFPRK